MDGFRKRLPLLSSHPLETLELRFNSHGTVGPFMGELSALRTLAPRLRRVGVVDQRGLLEHDATAFFEAMTSEYDPNVHAWGEAALFASMRAIRLQFATTALLSELVLTGVTSVEVWNSRLLHPADVAALMPRAIERLVMWEIFEPIALELIANPRFPLLHHLVLGPSRFSERVTDALAAPLPHLRSLEISGAVNARALDEGSPLLDSLSLTMPGASVLDTALPTRLRSLTLVAGTDLLRLATTPFRRLHSLTIYTTDIDEAGARALADSPHLATVADLNVLSCRLTAEAARILRARFPLAVVPPDA